jgi:hypothetical protein
VTLEQIFVLLETPGVPHLEERPRRRWERDTRAVPCRRCKRAIQEPGPRAAAVRDLSLLGFYWCAVCDGSDPQTSARFIAEHARANP